MIFAITYPATTLLGRGFLASLCYVVQDKAGKKPSMGKTPLKLDVRWCKALRMWAPGQTDSLLHLKSLDPRRLTQSKGPERGSPLPREPRKATPSQHGTPQRSPSNLSLAALSGVNHAQQSQPKGKCWSKIIPGKALALGASSSWS